MVGYYSGLLYTANYIGMLLTSYPWAMFSDRIGRRPVLLVSAISCLLLKLSMVFTRDYWTMVALRFTSGMMNASNSVFRTSMREAFRRHSVNDSHAFAYVSASYA